MSSAILIPARLSSTRLPDKLLLARTGMPLICHTVQTALQAVTNAPALFSEVIVATDDSDIFEAVNRFSQGKCCRARAVMTSPAHATGSDRIAEVAETLSAEVDVILNLQGDEPEMVPELLADLVRCLKQSGADIATIGCPISDARELGNPNLVKVVIAVDNTALYFSRAPIPYDRDSTGKIQALHHLGIYAYQREALTRFVHLPQGILEQAEKLEQLRALENGMRIAVMRVNEKPPKGIDMAEDYESFVTRFAAGKNGSGI